MIYFHLAVDSKKKKNNKISMNITSKKLQYIL